jgi:hypothetical protein
VNRIELEIKLNQDRVWLLETFAAMPEEDLNRSITTSRHNPESQWSAKDHLSHLIGIEAAFNNIFRRHLEGNSNPLGFPLNEDGTHPSREELMTFVHARNEEWVGKHHGKSFNEIVALGQKVRSETLALVASLTDEQLNEKIPNAPWSDGKIASIIAINGEHARRHYDQVKEALAKKE